MKRTHLTVAVCFLAIVSVFCAAGNSTTLVENNQEPFSFHKEIAQIDFEQSQRMLQFNQSPFFAQETESGMEQENVDIYGFKGKSLKRAFIYSMLVPGAGEFYAGSKIKAAVFLGLDITLWALYFNYHGKGNDKEDEYRSFADGHWSEDDYIYWLSTTYGIPNDLEPYEVDTINGVEVKKYFSHHLPDSKTDQYYEMIGKYEQFSAGWIDYNDITSLYRGTYLDMRRDANDLLNKATYSAMFSLANHILSAFDAAISVKKYNKKGERFSQLKFKMRLVEREREIVPRLTMSMEF